MVAQCEVGSGNKFRLWEDTWLGNSKLKSKFPKLYYIFVCHSRAVGEVGF